MNSVPYHFPREPVAPKTGWKIRVSRPFIAPEGKEAVLHALEKNDISSATAPARKLEEELLRFYGVPVARVCSNGYSSLVLALRAADIGRSQEVLIPAMTMVAVLNAVLTVGAIPVLVDCEHGQYNPAARQLKEASSPRTRAVIVAHTYGLACDMDGISTLCQSQGWLLIEDISEAIGTTYKGNLCGTIGEFACASLYANKLITAGDGGFLLAKDSTTAARIQSLTNHGFVQQFHFVHFEASGNYKMNGLGAALAAASVNYIPQLIAERVEIALAYRVGLADLESEGSLRLMPANMFGPDAPWVFGLEMHRPDWRLPVRQMLADHGIETRNYFFPLHCQPLLKTPLLNGSARLGAKSLPLSERMGDCGFYLPTYAGLSKADIGSICKVIHAAVENLKISATSAGHVSKL